MDTGVMAYAFISMFTVWFVFWMIHWFASWIMRTGF